MQTFVVLVLSAVIVGATQPATPAREEIENVAAFARLYGVVRYFYPSDAAAALDWNRFAVHGVAQHRRRNAVNGDDRRADRRLRVCARRNDQPTFDEHQLNRLDAEMELFSGTPQWKRTRALRELVLCPSGTSRTLRLDGPSAPPRDTALPCQGAAPTEKRPDLIAELAPGIWYVDLTRAAMEQVRPALDQLSRATGLIFDLRGYPTDAGNQILPHLVDATENDRWMHVANISGPFQQISGWNSFGWNLKPATPRLRGKRVFLTDGRAISYAESVMGYVADRKLATIIGGTTAGANGNVVSFEVPGGFSIPFTGMRVTRHDGQSPHHLVAPRHSPRANSRGPSRRA